MDQRETASYVKIHFPHNCGAWLLWRLTRYSTVLGFATNVSCASINERFVFNNKELNDKELANLLEEIERANNNEPITFFEILTP